MELCYGRYGVDSSVLAVITRNGGIMIRQLRPAAPFEAKTTISQLKMAPSVASPLPAKTQLYLEQLKQKVPDPSGIYSINMTDLMNKKRFEASSVICNSCEWRRQSLSWKP